MNPVGGLWLMVAVVAWWIGATAAAARRELVSLDQGGPNDREYTLLSLLRRLTDDPVTLALRLRFSRSLAAAFVPLGLAAAGAEISWEWVAVGAGAGWLAAVGSEAVGGGSLVQGISRLRGGAGYAMWARLTHPVARLFRSFLRADAEPEPQESPQAMVLAETRAAFSGRGARLGLTERRFFRRLLASTTILVSDIMTRWESVHTIDLDTPVSEAVEMIHRSGRSRHPVLDQGKVVGIVTAKDLLSAVHEDAPANSLRRHLRAVYFVREQETVQSLLAELQDAHVHLAVVLNYLGRPVGIATMEDVLEEIVGELYDEREREGVVR